MSAQLKRYLQQYAPWPEEALDEFVACFKTKKLISEQPSRFFLQAIEPVELLTLPKSTLLAF